ncbi:hypothetical protein D9M69_723790 [compost metagenome]
MKDIAPEVGMRCSQICRMPAPVSASTITAMPMVIIQKLHISTFCAFWLLATRPRSRGMA